MDKIGRNEGVTEHGYSKGELLKELQNACGFLKKK